MYGLYLLTGLIGTQILIHKILFALPVFEQPATLGVAHRAALASHSLLHALQERHATVGIARERPAPLHLLARCGDVANERNLRTLLEWQHVALVLQQHLALLRYFTTHLLSLLRADVCLIAIHIQIAVGILEEAELILRFEDAATSHVDVLLLHLAVLNQLLQIVHIGLTVQVHIHTCLQGTSRHILDGAHSVLHALIDALIVGGHKSVESPGIAQQFGHEIVVHVTWDALEIIE